MTKLLRVSGRECAKALQRAGFEIKPQTGSHMILRQLDPYAMAVVPNHSEIDRGTLKHILEQGQLTAEEFIDLL